MTNGIDQPGAEESGSGLFIRHSIAEVARLQIADALSSPRPPSFIALVGGAGAGKTTLLDRLYVEAMEAAAPAMRADPSVVPVARGRVPAPTSGRFNWHGFAAAIGTAFRAPARLLAVGGPTLGSRIHARQARNAAEALTDAAADVVLRQGRVLFLDEANHLGVMADQKRADVQFDALKDFAGEAGLTLVLAGTYDLLKLPHASAQLGRRTEIAHLRPYELGSARDLGMFRAIVAQLAEIISDPLPIDDSWLAELHDGSVGCVGLLVDWLLNAAHVHRLRGGTGSIRAAIRAKRRPAPYLAEVRAELALGRAMIGGTPGPGIDDDEPAGRRAPRTPPWTRNGQLLRPGERRPRRVSTMVHA